MQTQGHQPRRPLTDLSEAELRRALRATEEAFGPDSYSANALREALVEKRAARQPRRARQ